MKRMVSMALCVVGVAGFAFAGPKVEFGEDSWLKLSLLGQVHASYSDEMSPKTDVFLRRGRLILAGQISDGILVFAETDNDKAGKAGTGNVSTDIQDIFVDVRLADSDHWVKAGLILLPFSFESRASAASLLGIDYNAETIKLVNTFVWRDYGVELHGDFLSKRVAYAVGAFDGYDTTAGNKNPDADTRFTGHVILGVIGEAETGWFYSQNRLGAAGTYLSLGAGFDQQNKASLIPVAEGETGDPTVDDSKAWVVDFKAGTDLGCLGLTVNGAWYDWDSSVYDGTTSFVETGLLAGKTMLTGKYAIQDPTGGDATEDYTAGVHFFANKHNLRYGIEYRWGDSAETTLAGLQFLL